MPEDEAVFDSDGLTISAPKASFTSRCMPNLKRVAALVIVALLGYGIFVVVSKHPLQKSRTNYASISVAELEEYDDDDNCLMSIHDKVYDLTSYASQHPGGSVYILSFCGMNATDAFAEYHDESMLNAAQSFQVGLLQTDSSSPDPTPAPVTEEVAPVSICVEQIYSEAEIQQHDYPDDCWYVLYGVVWDMTDLLEHHIGGVNILLPWCGRTDSLPAYEAIANHNMAMLHRRPAELGLDLKIGLFGAESGTILVDCNTGLPVPEPNPEDDASDSENNVATASPSVAPVPSPPQILPPSPVLTSLPALEKETLQPSLRPNPQPSLRPTLPPSPSPVALPASLRPTRAPLCVVQSYARDEISRHNSRDDCWISLYGKVWDMTSKLHKKNGCEMKRWCGRSEEDTTRAFESTKWHGMEMLNEKMAHLAVGRIGSVTALVEVPC